MGHDWFTKPVRDLLLAPGLSINLSVPLGDQMFKKTKVCTGLMLAFGGGLTLGSLPALAQDTPQRVEITGSAIKRIDAETALPVQVLTRQDIQRTGAGNVEQLLQTIS